VREYLSTAGRPEAGWLGALKDPQIGQALALMHLQPSETWTVESLASRVGLSRSALSANFTRVVGMPPGHYQILQLWAPAFRLGGESRVAPSSHERTPCLTLERVFSILVSNGRTGAPPARK